MKKMTAQDMFDEAFFPGRPARSEEYRQGVFKTLAYNVDQAKRMHKVPYEHGTAEFDAYFAGAVETMTILEAKLKTGWKP
jgi:hypothetical protein